MTKTKVLAWALKNEKSGIWSVRMRKACLYIIKGPEDSVIQVEIKEHKTARRTK